MTIRTWEIRYKLQQQGKYFFRRVDAVYQHEANKIFDAEMPSAIRCGSARSVQIKGKNQFPMTKTFGGSPQCTEENMEYALKKLKEYSDPKIKYTFRQWMNRFMNILDLIDQG